MKAAIRSGGIVTLFIALIHTINAHGDALYFIDAHSQFDHKVVPLQKIISLMEQGGVSHTILSARGKLKVKDLIKFSSKYHDRITPAVRTTGKLYDTESPKYYKMLKAQVASRKYSAIAEVLLYHAKKGNKDVTNEIYNELIHQGYIVGNRWAALRIDPPLILTEAEFSGFIDAFKTAIQSKKSAA